MKKLSILIPIVVILALPLVVGAQITQEQTFVSGVSNISQVLGIINNISVWFMSIVVGVSVFFFVMAGFLYVTSGGAEEKLKSAKNYLIYGIVGVIVALLAGAILVVVQNLVSST